MIAYGGPFGEWNIYGPGAWFAGFAIYWAVVTVYLAMFGAVLRGVVEIVVAGRCLTGLADPVAFRRRALRWRTGIYVVGVGVFLALRFAPW